MILQICHSHKQVFLRTLARIIEGRDGEDEYVLDPEAIYDDDIELV